MRTKTTVAAGRVKTRTGCRSTKWDHAATIRPPAIRVGKRSVRVSLAMLQDPKREEALAGLLSSTPLGWACLLLLGLGHDALHVGRRLRRRGLHVAALDG